MKKFLFQLIALCFFISTAFAQDMYQSRPDKPEDMPHTSGHMGMFCQGVRNDSAATTLTSTDGDYSPFALDSAGRLHIVASGTAAGQFAEDSAHASAAIGSFILTVRNDAGAATLTSTDGDYSPLAVGSKGQALVDVLNALPAGTNAIGKLAANSGVDIGDVTVDNAAGTNSIPVQGNVAYDGVQAGNPVYSGGIARTGDPTAVAAADSVGSTHDTLGKQVVFPYSTTARLVTGTTGVYTSATAQEMIPAQGAGISTYLTQITCINRNAVTAVTISILDGAVVKGRLETGGTIGPSTSTVTFPAPLAGTANTAWNVQSSSSTADQACFGSGFIATN